MIDQKIQESLNEQINEEYRSWYFYRSAAAHCYAINLTGLGKWLRHRSDGKLSQASKVSDFILQRHGRVEFPPIKGPGNHWDSPLAILDAALDQERDLGEFLAELMDGSLREGDHATYDFLEQIRADQTKDEATVETLRERLKLVGDAPTGLLMFDMALA